MYRFYRSPRTLAEALALKAEYGDQARIAAGTTDLLLEIERGVRRAPDGGAPGLIDLTRIPGLADIRLEDGALHLGPLVTHNQCVASPLVVAHAFPLARACWEVGAPQIRNRGTLAGNIITASPANDAVVPLLALDATVTVASLHRGVRTLPLARFLTGFRRVDLAPDEILTAISVPLRDERQPGVFIKLGLRRAQAISVVSVAAVAERDGAGPDAPVVHAAIALGAVAPTVVRAAEAETYLLGRPLTEADPRGGGAAGARQRLAHRRHPQRRRLPPSDGGNAGDPQPAPDRSRFCPGRLAGRPGAVVGPDGWPLAGAAERLGRRKDGKASRPW